MKVLFLDIDGVLNSDCSLKNNSNEIIDRNNVQILRDIVDRTGAVIIMSSGWRLWFDDNMNPQAGYSQYLYDIFKEFSLSISGKMPDFSTEEIRKNRTFSMVKAKEISAWLNTQENIEQYVVLDDLFLKDEEINRHLVKTDSKIGLTKEDADQVLRMFALPF